jgi:hypothetical protein
MSHKLKSLVKDCGMPIVSCRLLIATFPFDENETILVTAVGDRKDIYRRKK